MLALDVEWLLGVCFAGHSPASEEPDWPPQPDRIFSALVASWGARGESDDERQALLWLERQAPPSVWAIDSAWHRTSVTSFVPPNDAATSNLAILPDRRRRQPRRFPAVALPRQDGVAHLRLSWLEAPAPDVLARLQDLADTTSYVGHSSSLVRCRFHISADFNQVGSPATRAPYKGRMVELERLYDRHMRTADANARPLPAPVYHSVKTSDPVVLESHFGRNWDVLEYAEGDRPDARATAEVGRVMRCALMSAWQGTIPEWISGHQPDGAPSRQPHLAVVPMINAGWAWSDGAWYGIGLVPPRDIEKTWTASATQAAGQSRRLYANALHALEGSDGLIELRLGRLGVVRLRYLEATGRDTLQSLRPDRYGAPARTWTTVTPIALDRHPKRADLMTEGADIIADSCARVGLPKPASVLVHKHAAAIGAASAWPPSGAPRWANWYRPGVLANRPFVHATIHFSESVRGPVILGAGRFLGLGLCLPSQGDGSW